MFKYDVKELRLAYKFLEEIILCSRLLRKSLTRCYARKVTESVRDIFTLHPYLLQIMCLFPFLVQCDG